MLSTEHQCLAVVCPERLSDKIPDSCELSSRQASSFSAWHQDFDLSFPSAWDFGKFLLVGVHCLDNLLTGSDGTPFVLDNFSLTRVVLLPETDERGGDGLVQGI